MGKRRYFLKRGDWARCEDCHKRLDYKIGSIMADCVDDDLCPACHGKRAAKESVVTIKQELHEELK